MFNRSIFSVRIRALRQHHGLTLVQLGAQFGISKQSAQRWETGENIPTGEKLVDIADYFDVSLDYLVGRTDDPKGGIK